MRQFFVLLLTGFGIAVLELIDSAFGNNLGIDSIVVMSAFTVIFWCANTVGNLGKFAYEVKLKDFSECAILQLLSSSAVSIFLLLLYRQIPYIFHLSGETQYELLSKCIFHLALAFPLRRITEYIYHYAVLQCKNMVVVATNVSFYTVMIVLDALVIIFKGRCYHLVITTNLSYVVNFVHIVVAAKIWRDFNHVSLREMKSCWLSAKDIMINKCLGKVATVVFNVLASYLGTELYALHGIGYAIATSSEPITSAWYQYQVIKLHEITNPSEKLIRCKEIQRKTFLPAIALSYVLMLILIIPLHGQTDLTSAFLISCLYMTQCFALCVYENAIGLLNSLEATKIVKWGGLVGIFVRIPIAVISVMTPIGLIGFALGSGIDFLARGIFYEYQARKSIESPKMMVMESQS